MELDVLNRGPVRNKDGSRPRHLGAVSAVEDSQSASPTKSSTDPTRRQGGQQPGRGSGGGDNKEGAQDPSSKGKQQSSSLSSKPKMEQMLNRVMQRLDKLELEKGQRHPAPPHMPRPPASAGGAEAPSWQQTGIYVPQHRQPQEFDFAIGQAQRRGPFFCYNCEEVGHFKRDCPAPVNNGARTWSAGWSSEQRRINGHRTRISRTVEFLAGSRRLNESTYVQRSMVGLGSACWTVGARSHSSQRASSTTGRFSGRSAISGRLTAWRFRSRVGSRSPPTPTEVVWRSAAW